MKNLFILLLSFVVFQITSLAQVKNIHVAEFEKLSSELTESEVLLDVRSKSEVKSGHIKGMINIDFYSDDFENQIKQLDKSKTYYVYCAAGGRSMKAANMMTIHGINNVYNLNGGITAWKKEGKTITK